VRLLKTKFRRKAKAAPASHPARSLLHRIIASLEDDKAIDLSIIELEGKSSLADFMVVVSGRSQRHVGAMADHLMDKLKAEGFAREKPEGLPDANWVVIDAHDVIVHLFRPDVRGFYNLEKMWAANLP
jgi:ribosome-associated protein